MTAFYRNIFTVLTGTGIAQLIPVIGSLIIVRIFSPSIFGEYAFWLSITLIFAVVVSGRFETCIAVKSPGVERNTAIFFTFVTIIIGALIFTITLLSLYSLIEGVIKLSQPELILLTPAAAALTASIQLIISYYASEGSFKRLSLARIIQSALVLTFQLLAGMLCSNNIYALVISHFIALCLTILIIYFRFNLTFDFCQLKVKDVTQFWKENKKYLQYSLPADTISSLSAELPILLAVSKYGSDAGGILALTFRVLGAPIGLVAKAVLDVFKKYAADEYRERGHCRTTFLKTLKILSILSFSFFIFSVFFIEEIFKLAFGKEWASAGEAAKIMLGLFALRFIASPLSYVVYISESQEVDLYWQVSLLIVTVLSFVILSDLNQSLFYYNLGYSILYFIYLVICYKMACGNVNK